MGWWRGCTPTVARAMALNVGMLATYDQTKDMLTEKFGAGQVWTLGVEWKKHMYVRSHVTVCYEECNPLQRGLGHLLTFTSTIYNMTLLLIL